MIKIALIHNGEIDRLDYARPILKQVATCLKGEYFEIFEQVPPRLTFRNIISRQVRYYFVIKRWNQYLREKKFLNHNFFNRIYLSLRLLQPSEISKFLKRGRGFNFEADHCVSEKHVKAINRFLKTSEDGDFLIVFESDAIIKSIEILLKYIRYSSNQNSKDFFIFANHFSAEEIDLDSSQIIEEAHKEFTVFKYPKYFTNTLCSYGMSFTLAQEISSEFNLFSSRLLFPSDWLLNAAFLSIFERNSKNFEVPATIFFNPHAVLNGSLTKEYRSVFK